MDNPLGRPTADWWPALVRCPRCGQEDTTLTRPWRSDSWRAFQFRCSCGYEWWKEGIG